MKLRYIIMNVANIIEKQVLDLHKTTAYQKLPGIDIEVDEDVEDMVPWPFE